jgi:DUF1680 family protein
MSRISRRQLLGQGGALVCVCRSARFAFAQDAAAATPLLKELPYSAVQLEAGPMREQLEAQQQLFLGIDDDKLLKPFRLRAGMDAPGEDMGGWYDQSADFHVDPKDWSTANWHGFIPGHSFGQYVSGLARGYAITRDAATREKVARLVVKFAATISPKFFADYNLPAYTYDKLVVGLIDAYQHAGVTEARDALSSLTDVALPFLPEKALTREERRARPYEREAQIWDEPYTLPENLFLAWRRGMGERYKALALRYLQNDALFDPLSRGESPLKGKHAYSHVNALSSAVQAHLATGERRYLDAALNGFGFVQAQSFATGGWGANEELLAADDRDTNAAMLKSTHRAFETPCGAYAHFKITRSLLRLTRESRYGDSMERVLYNTILGALPTQPTGETFYYSDYNERATKFYRDEAWPCCSGTFVQLAADYGISGWFADDRDLYVNLYAPSTVTASLRGGEVTVTQSTNYPFENQVVLTIVRARAGSFAIRLRVPQWAGPEASIRVNGRPEAVAIKPGSFAEVRRHWRAGDVLEVSFDMRLRLEPLNDAHPELVALMYGPLALFPIDRMEIPLRADQWLGARRRGQREWSVNSTAVPIRLLPFMAITNETYRLYSRLATA